MPNDNRMSIVIEALNKTQGSFDQIKKQFSELQTQAEATGSGIMNAFSGFSGSIGGLLGIGGLTGLVGTLAAITVKAGEAGTALVELSQKIGIPVESLGRLQKAAEYTHTDMDILSRGVGIFVKGLQLNNDENSDFGRALSSIGLSIKELKNLSPEDAIKKVAEQFEKSKDGAGKTAVAMELFGRSGKELIPMLNSLNEKLEGLTSNFTGEQAKAAEQFNENMIRMKQNVTSLWHEIGNELIPTLNNMAAALGKADKASNLYSKMASIDDRIKEIEHPSLLGIDLPFLGHRKGSIADAQLTALKKERLEIASQLMDLQSVKTPEKDKTEIKVTPKADTVKDLTSSINAINNAVEKYKETLEAMDPSLTKTDKDLIQWASHYADISRMIAQSQAPDADKKKAMLQVNKIYSAGAGEIVNKNDEETAKEYQALMDELNRIGKTGADKDITNLDKWFDERVQKFKDNEQAIINLVESYNKQYAKIQSDKARQSREDEINNQLASISSAEKGHTIDKTDAAQQRIKLNEELLQGQLQYLASIDRLNDPTGWNTQEKAIIATRDRLIELQILLKEQTGSFTEGMEEGMRQYTENLKTNFQNGRDIVLSTANSMEHGFENFFDYTSKGFMDLRNLVNNIAHDIYTALMKAFITQPLTNSLMGMLGGSSGSSGGGLFGMIAGLLGIGGGGGYTASQLTVPGADAYGPGIWAKLANGGIMTSQGSIPLNKYSMGGIAFRPQMALYGEGRNPEAYVPLPDGRTIPVTMQGGGSNSVSSTVHFNGDIGGSKQDVSNLQSLIHSTVDSYVREHM